MAVLLDTLYIRTQNSSPRRVHVGLNRFQCIKQTIGNVWEEHGCTSTVICGRNIAVLVIQSFFFLVTYDRKAWFLVMVQTTALTGCKWRGNNSLFRIE